MQAVAGWVLAGGYSRRLGSDKALLLVHGETLAARTADRVGKVAGSVTLVGRPDRLQLGLPALEDFEPGQGPLGGMLTALASSSAEWNLICACDFPHLDGLLLERLVRTAQASTADAVVPRTPAGKPQPLCAVYSRTCLEPFRSAYGQGIRAVWRALACVRVEWVDTADDDWAFNLNTTQDLSALHYGG